MKKIVILNGYATAGKNSFVDFCSKYANVHHYSYVDYARNVVAPLCGYTGGKTEKERNFLADLNDILIKYYDLPYRNIRSVAKNFLYNDEENGILFIDIREPKAIKRACDEFKAVSVFVDNNNVERITSNHADANVRNYEYDYIIDNDGTLEQLEESAKTFVEDLMG